MAGGKEDLSRKKDVVVAEKNGGIDWWLYIMNLPVSGRGLVVDNFGDYKTRVGNFLDRKSNGLPVEPAIESCLRFWIEDPTLRMDYSSLMPALRGMREVCAPDYSAQATLWANPESTVSFNIGGVNFTGQDVLYRPERRDLFSSNGARLMSDRRLQSPVVLLPENSSRSLIEAWGKLVDTYWNTACSVLEPVRLEARDVGFAVEGSWSHQWTEAALSSTMSIGEWFGREFGGMEDGDTRPAIGVKAANKSPFLAQLCYPNRFKDYCHAERIGILKASIGNDISTQITELRAEKIKIYDLKKIIENTLRKNYIQSMEGVGVAMRQVLNQTMNEKEIRKLGERERKQVGMNTLLSAGTWLYAAMANYGSYIDQISSVDK